MSTRCNRTRAFAAAALLFVCRPDWQRQRRGGLHWHSRQPELASQRHTHRHTLAVGRPELHVPAPQKGGRRRGGPQWRYWASLQEDALHIGLDQGRATPSFQLRPMELWTSGFATCPHALRARLRPSIVSIGFRTKRRDAIRLALPGRQISDLRSVDWLRNDLLSSQFACKNIDLS